MYMPNTYITHDPYMFKIDVTMVNFYHAIVVIVTNNPIGCTDDGHYDMAVRLINNTYIRTCTHTHTQSGDNTIQGADIIVFEY